MEWWENSYEPVSELSQNTVKNAWNKRMLRGAIPGTDPFGKKSDVGKVNTAVAYGKRLPTDHLAKTGLASTAARTAATGALAYGAYKGGKALYNKFKNRNKGKEEDAKAANEGWSWYDDPGAMSIMESYFDEFADADMQ